MTFRLGSVSIDPVELGSRGNAELEMAKTTLRRAGWVVFNSSVDGGPKGLIRVDGKDYDSFTVIEMARKVGP